MGGGESTCCGRGEFLMAALPAVYYRNYTSDDTVYDDNHGRSGEATVDIETLG